MTPALAAARWRRGLWVVRTGRWIALCSWLAAMAVATFGSAPCTPDNPAICGPGRGEPLVIALLLATPILLWVQLGAGYATAIAGGALDVIYDPDPTARATLGSYAVVCMGLLAALTLVRRRQLIALPTRATAMEWLATPWRGRALLAVLLACGTVGCLYGYGQAADRIAEHVGRAEHVQATVRATDGDADRVTLWLSATEAKTLEVLDASTYRSGESVPVLVDRSTNPAWVQLVAEPEDVTWWQSLALVAGLLGGLALVRPIRDRMWRTDMSVPDAMAMVITPDPRGSGSLLSLPGETPPLARVMLRPPGDESTRESRWRTEGPDDLSTPAPRPVLVAGELWIGGQVTIAEQDGTAIGRSTLRLPRLPRLLWLRGRSPRPTEPGELVTRTVDLRDVQLPVTVGATPAARRRGLALLAGSVVLLTAVPVTVHLDTFHPALIGAAATGWALWLQGATMMTWRLVVEHTGVRVGTAVREYRVGWRALYGVRESPSTLFLAWGPGERVYEFPVAGSAEDVAGLIESLRQRVDAIGGMKQPPSSRLRPGLLLVGLYPIAAAAVAWYLITH